MVHQTILITLIGVASSILYRMGGAEGYNTKYRDFGCPMCFCLAYAILSGFTWWMLACFIVMFGAMTTYWDEFFDGTDNFFMHGACIGASTAFLAFDGVSIGRIILYAGCLSISMGLVNYFANKNGWKHSDIAEEMSRGAMLIVYLPILVA